jgi:hypothetical protein
MVVLHHGPWSHGPHGPNTKLFDARVPELLEEGGVDLVISGHDHVYERGASGAIKYVVSGGGGAPLGRSVEGGPTTEKIEATYHFVHFRTSAGALQMTAKRADGSVIERCALAKGRAWECSATESAVRTAPRETASLFPTASSPSVERAPGVTLFGLILSGLAAVVSVHQVRRRAGDQASRS